MILIYFSDTYTARNLTCDVGYRPENENKISLRCSDGKWEVIGNSEQNSLCSPVCISACLNGGLCTSPDVCTCSSDHYGEFCQFKKCGNSSIHHGNFDIKLAMIKYSHDPICQS